MTDGDDIDTIEVNPAALRILLVIQSLVAGTVGWMFGLAYAAYKIAHP